VASLPARPLTHYVVVRADIPYGSIVAQTIHAAGESVLDAVPDGTYAVALAAKGEHQLLVLEQSLLAKGIPHAAVRESDEPYSGQLMAIGVAPCDRSLVREEMRKFSLIK